MNDAPSPDAPPPSPAPMAKTAGWRRKSVLAGVLLGLVGLGLAWKLWPGSGTAADGASGGPGGAPRRFGNAGPQPVTVAIAQQRDIRVLVSAIGSIAAANTAVVRSRVDGELKALYFKEGQPVRAGQMLAQIDPQPFQIALAQAEGSLARDQAQLKNAQLDLQRYRDLVAKDAAPKQQLDTQEALVAQLRGTVLTDQANVDNARLQLSYTHIVAPISGLAGLKQADLGNTVHASDAAGLLTIAQTQPVNVVFGVPDSSLTQIRQQLKAGTPLKVEAWDREQKVLLGVGKVDSTDNAIDPATSTIRVKALFANTDNALFPNQFVNVRLQLDTLGQALAVPSAAVQRGAQGSFVYVVAEDNAVSLRRVSPGATDGDWVAIQGDVKPGEKVVTDGADRLRDGAKVEIITPTAAKAWSGQRRDGASRPAGAASVGKAAPAAAPGAAPGAAPADAPAATAAAEPAAAASGERPRWMDKVPPEVAAKLQAMSPEERRAWFQQRREAQADKAN